MSSEPLTITFVTSNAGKLREVQQVLSASGANIRVVNQNVDLIEIQAESIEEVSLDKVKRAAEAIDGPVLVEDTCLCFNALGGLPGAYIKWFKAKLGLEGLNKMLVGFEDKSAEAVCTLAYSPGKGAEPILFQGRTQGKIVMPRGNGQFGWDPVFEYEGNGQTYAEMQQDEKNAVSHRGKAVKKMCEYFVAQQK